MSIISYLDDLVVASADCPAVQGDELDCGGHHICNGWIHVKQSSDGEGVGGFGRILDLKILAWELWQISSSYTVADAVKRTKEWELNKWQLRSLDEFRTTVKTYSACN